MLREIILKFMSPKMRADVEESSRNWVAVCPRCQAQNSIWDIGGVRHQAAGAKSSLARCTSCGKTSFMQFSRKR